MQFDVADFLDLQACSTVASFPGIHGRGAFDVVMAIDNCIAHLLHDKELDRALMSMRNALRPGGLLLLSLRDYDEVIAAERAKDCKDDQKTQLCDASTSSKPHQVPNPRQRHQRIQNGKLPSHHL